MITSLCLILSNFFMEFNLVWLIIRLLPAGCLSVPMRACLSSLEWIITSVNQFWMNPRFFFFFFFLEVIFVNSFPESLSSLPPSLSLTNSLVGHFMNVNVWGTREKNQSSVRETQLSEQYGTRLVCVCKLKPRLPSIVPAWSHHVRLHHSGLHWAPHTAQLHWAPHRAAFMPFSFRLEPSGVGSPQMNF